MRVAARGFAAILLLLAAGCEEDLVVDPPAPSAEPAVFVVNSRGETLSRILLADGTVAADALVLGGAPNAIAVLPGGHEGLVLSSLSNRADIVDLDQLAVRDEVDFGPGSNPYAIALGPGGAYVSCFLSDEVVRVDHAQATIVRRIPVGRGPEGLLVVESAGAGAEGDLYVALTGYTPAGYQPGVVAVIALGADTVRARIPVGRNPQAFARAPDGTVHVVCTGNYGTEEGRVFVIDPAGPAVIDSLAIGGSPVTALVLGDGRGLTAGYAGGLKVYERDGSPAREMAALSGDGWFTALAYDAVDSLLYVTDFDDSVVHEVNPWTDTRRRTFRVGHGPAALALRR